MDGTHRRPFDRRTNVWNYLTRSTFGAIVWYFVNNSCDRDWCAIGIDFIQCNTYPAQWIGCYGWSCSVWHFMPCFLSFCVCVWMIVRWSDNNNHITCPFQPPMAINVHCFDAFCLCEWFCSCLFAISWWCVHWNICAIYTKQWQNQWHSQWLFGSENLVAKMQYIVAECEQ